MEHRSVIKKYQAWAEGGLGAEERRNVERHLDECQGCREYYRKMSLLFEKPDPALLPRLAPDPYLPARIRALGGERKTGGSVRTALGWVRASLATAMLVLAVTAGVYLGKGLSTRAPSGSEVDLADAYYEAFSPRDFAGGWENLLGDVSRNGLGEAER